MPSQTIDVTTPDGVADCYLATPDDSASHPGVLFYIDAFGVRDRIREMADHISAQGYAVLAPNVFYRGGRAPLWEDPDFSDPAAREAFFAQLGPLRADLAGEHLTHDSAAYLDALAQHSRGPAAITGYCMGGVLGWRTAAAHPDRVAALGGFHTGGLVTDAEDSPHRLAPSVRAEIYWGFADHDRSMDADAIAEMDRTMDDAGLTSTSEIYAGAAHGYTMADRADAWNPEACERHYENLFALLGRTVAA